MINNYKDFPIYFNNLKIKKRANFELNNNKIEGIYFSDNKIIKTNNHECLPPIKPLSKMLEL